METEIKFVDGARFEVHARNHVVICDQPLDNGGADTGLTPPEFLLASLGTCTAYYAIEYLRARGLSTVGVTAKLTAEKLLKPARLANFVITIDVPGLTDPKHREGILRSAKNCLIHNTLLHAPSVEVVVS